MPLNRALTDLGGVPVLWDSDTGTLVQDPTQGGTNSYGPGDLFRDPNNGDVYQLQQDGTLSLYRVGTPPAVPTVAGAVAPIIGNTVSSAGSSWTNAPTQTGGPAITATGNPTQFGHQVVTWLSRASFIGGLPNGVLVLMGAVGYMFLKQRRRRNPRPILRNPGRRRRAERGEYRHKQRAEYAEPSSVWYMRGLRTTDQGRAEAARLRYGYRRGSGRASFRADRTPSDAGARFNRLYSFRRERGLA